MNENPKNSQWHETFSISVNSVTFNKAVFFSLLGIEGLLVLLDATIYYGEWTSFTVIRALCNLTREDSLATWFASTQSLLISLVLLLVFLRIKAENVWRGRGWALLALFFVYMAVDDSARIHERIAAAIQVVTDRKGAALGEPLLGYPSYTWHLVYAPFLGAMFMFILLFLWKELKISTLRLLLVVSLSCYAIAIGIDFIEGTKDGFNVLAKTLSLNVKGVSHFTRVLEEFLEMFGTTVLLVCLLNHSARISPVFSIKFK